MKIYIDNHTYRYEMENLVRMFLPNDDIEVCTEILDNPSPPYVLTRVENDGDSQRVFVNVHTDSFNKSAQKEVTANGESAELEMSLILFNLLSELTGMNPPWGILTGVRPIKLFRKYKSAGGTDFAKTRFRDVLRVSDEKISLAEETEKYESAIIARLHDNSFSLYISVPFCPSRCSYCSFVSESVERTEKLVEPYTQLLCREIELTAEYAHRNNLRLETVYMGGGTPTTLSAHQLQSVLGTVSRCFDLSSCAEFTVEAGRPDTITRDKLIAVANCGADRVSINPQTLNDDILKSVGRRHTAQQTLDAFALARDLSFNHINMDLIAGLPSESCESFMSTLQSVTDLAPESVTVHTLAMKRSSYLNQSGRAMYARDAAAVQSMLAFADKKLHECGYHPYYLYRQRKMVGNMENVGWCKEGRECLYNVYIMDETHTILACGAGAVTKLRDVSADTIERIYNFKYPYEYINRFDELIKRKERIDSFYAEHNKRLQTLRAHTAPNK